MDPNAALAGIREIVAKTYREGGAPLDDLSRVIDFAESFDEWLTKGGFLPDAWKIAAPDAGKLSPNDHILTRAGSDLDNTSLPYVIGTSLMLYPDTPLFVRLKKNEHRAVVQFGYVDACLSVYANAGQISRLATLFANARDRLV